MSHLDRPRHVLHALRDRFKLRGRTPAELRVRGVQALNAHLERLRLSPHTGEPADQALFRRLDPGRLSRHVRDAEAVLAHFRTRQGPRFFASVAVRSHTLETLRRCWPEAPTAGIESADRIKRGQFDLFGWRDAQCAAEAPDWHLEPRSGKRAPLRHW